MVVGARQPRRCRDGLESHLPASALADRRRCRRTPGQRDRAPRVRRRTAVPVVPEFGRVTGTPGLTIRCRLLRLVTLGHQKQPGSYLTLWLFA